MIEYVAISKLLVAVSTQPDIIVVHSAVVPLLVKTCPFVPAEPATCKFPEISVICPALPIITPLADVLPNFNDKLFVSIDDVLRIEYVAISKLLVAVPTQPDIIVVHSAVDPLLVKTCPFVPAEPANFKEPIISVTPIIYILDELIHTDVLLLIEYGCIASIFS